MKTVWDFLEAKSPNNRNSTSHRFRHQSSPQQNERALTRLHVLIIIGMLALLAVVLASKVSNAAQRARRISCVCHLKQVGLAYRMWSQDHSNHFPWQLSITNSGTLEWINISNISVHFATASNELNSPKVLVCPSDRARSAARNFSAPFGADNISYFIGLDADETMPQTILSGDRNVTTNGTVRSGLFLVHDRKQLQWSPSIHQSVGNIGLGDGSVQQCTAKSLIQQFEWQAQARAETGPARIILP